MHASRFYSIELLVVIAIIAVLIALPYLPQARPPGECVNNLKQIGLAIGYRPTIAPPAAHPVLHQHLATQ